MKHLLALAVCCLALTYTASSLQAQACIPKTSCPLGNNCGTLPDGCGGTINCGTCTGSQTCGGSGTPNVCGYACIPLTSCPQGYSCGSYPNGCGGTISCGTCTAPQTCGGSGTPNVCGTGCLTCAALNFNCGNLADGCGHLLSCGTCASPQTCGGGGTANVCGSACVPLTSCPQGNNCGTISDGCGGTVSCGGACNAPQTCGGGGTPNVCGSAPAPGVCGTLIQGLLQGLIFSYHYETVGSNKVSTIGLFMFGPPSTKGNNTPQQTANAHGLLNVDETSNNNGFVARSIFQGRWQVNSDCSGGQVQFSNHVFDTVFISSMNNISGFYFASTGPDGLVLTGEAQLNMSLTSIPK